MKKTLYESKRIVFVKYFGLAGFQGYVKCRSFMKLSYVKCRIYMKLSNHYFHFYVLGLLQGIGGNANYPLQISQTN